MTKIHEKTHEIHLKATDEGLEFTFLINGEEQSFKELNEEDKNKFITMISTFTAYFAPVLNMAYSVLN